MTVNVAVIGATGRLGRVVSDIIEATEGFALVAALDSKASLSEMDGADVAFDVTVPGVSSTVVDHALSAGLSVIVGTSGWSAERLVSLERRLGPDPEQGVIVVPNFSVGSVLATSLAATAARFFDSIEIIEAHHASKVDSPSGTAVRTAEVMAAARSSLGPVEAPHADQRARGQQVASIPIHSLRLHGVQARQEVVFGGVGETLSVKHDTISATSYERGIRLALTSIAETRGLVIGLDRLLGITL